MKPLSVARYAFGYKRTLDHLKAWRCALPPEAREAQVHLSIRGKDHTGTRLAPPLAPPTLMPLSLQALHTRAPSPAAVPQPPCQHYRGNTQRDRVVDKAALWYEAPPISCPRDHAVSPTEGGASDTISTTRLRQADIRDRLEEHVATRQSQ